MFSDALKGLDKNTERYIVKKLNSTTSMNDALATQNNTLLTQNSTMAKRIAVLEALLNKS